MLTAMPAARGSTPPQKRPEDTQPLALEDLVQVPPPPPVPPGPVQGEHPPAGRDDGAVLGAAAATRSGPSGVSSRRLAVHRVPWRRLLKAYTTTVLVAGSYLWLSLQRRFRGPDRLEALT